MGYIGKFPTAVPLGATDIPDLPASKITSGTIADARIPDLATSKITSGTFADARIASSNVTQQATTYDDNKIQTNLALLAFKTQVNGSLAKYELQDNVIDEFQDNSGINASSSTNELFATGQVGSNITGGTEAAVTAGTGTAIGNMALFSGISSAFNGTTSTGYANAAGYASSGSNADPSYIGKNWGSGKMISKFRWYGSNNDSFQTNGTNTMTLKLFGNSTNDFASATQIGTTETISNARTMDTYHESSQTFPVNNYQYHWVAGYTTNSATHIATEIEFWEKPLTFTDLTLVSTATTANAAPTSSDLVILMKNKAGTATINTDIKGFISRDNGSNFTEVTLVDEGTYSTNTKILVAHDVDISSQPSGTSMVYKITTHNQALTKETEVHAVSLGWK